LFDGFYIKREKVDEEECFGVGDVCLGIAGVCRVF